VSATDLLQAIVDGILTGGVYALMAAGLTLIFGVMDIINIAQGIMVILGGYLSSCAGSGRATEPGCRSWSPSRWRS
jgi:branched-chain amino acid transport system permease protein